MSWIVQDIHHPSLPDHCAPANDFLLRFSSTFHTCVPTPLAFVSNTLGALSIVSWLFSQLPQIYKNWSVQSTSGLSIFFLVEWCLGDLSNLLGALFTHQASWQVAIACYYVFVDCCLIAQWIWFEKLRHGHSVLRVWKRSRRRHDDASSTSGSVSGSMQEVLIEGLPRLDHEAEDEFSRHPSNRNSDPAKTGAKSCPRIIFRPPSFQQNSPRQEPRLGQSPSNGRQARLVPSSSPLPSPSPRTMLLVACLVALAHASPVSRPATSTVDSSSPTALERIGTVLSWLSTFLYLGSRLPQLLKNWRRKSTAGLSPLLFLAAFGGNLFYASALVANPCAWSDLGPYGGGGWVGRAGSERVPWMIAALPFFLGAAGVLLMDGAVGVQFCIYGEGEEKLIVIEREPGARWHWRRVSGWMRGWVPTITTDAKGTEREALARTRHGGYGAL